MPTTRRRRVRRRLAAPLSPAIVDYLLTGDTLSSAEAERLAHEGIDYDPLDVFDVSLDGLADLWRRHRAELTREFHRRHLPGRPWAARHFDDQEAR